MNGTLNKVILIGHLGDEVKMHYFEGGNCIGRFPLATNEVYINKTTGEKMNGTILLFEIKQLKSVKNIFLKAIKYISKDA